MTSALASVVLASMLFTCGAANAEESKDYEDTVHRAVAEFDSGNWDEAYALFRRAHGLSPNARTWRGIGVVAFELRLYVETIDSLEAALEDERKPLTAQQRSEAKTLIGRAREFVAQYQVKLEPADAVLLVDGRPAHLEGDTLILDPGQHTLTARAPVYTEQSTALRAAAGSREQLAIALQHERTSASVLDSGKQVDAPSQPHFARPWTWSFAGAALAAGATGIGLAVSTKHQHDDLAQCSTNAPGQGCAAATKGLHLQRATNATFATAGVLVGAAVAAYFLEARAHRRDQHRTMLFPTRDGLMMQGSF